jgi:predicted histidine transporter YuiF (NhaC family)
MDRIQSLFLQEKSLMESFILTGRTYLLAYSLVRFCPFKDLDDFLARIVNTFAAIGYSFVLCADSHVVISTRFHCDATVASYFLRVRLFVTPPDPHP